MAFEVPALTYAYEALEPYIDAQTMHLHHDKHHQAYVDNANAAVEKAPELKGKSAEEILANLAAVPEAVRGALRNNARRTREPHDVLGHHGPQRRRRAHRPDCRRDHQDLRRLRPVPGEAQRCRCEAVRQRLDLAGARFRRTSGALHAQSGQSDLAGPALLLSATTSGSTPTISSIRTAAPST